MFRFSIRELLLVTLAVGMGTAWAIEHQALSAVRKDAEFLARRGIPSMSCLGDGGWIETARKYYGSAGDETRLIIVSEDEARLGLNSESN